MLDYKGLVRTVKITNPYQERQGKNGTFATINFVVATDREYKQCVTKADGTVVQERKPDFFLCRATGGTAKAIADYASATKIDANGQVKLISRRMEIKGHLETYDATRNEIINIPNVGQVSVDLPNTNTILIVDHVEFIDANPNSAQPTANGTVAQATIIGQPQAQVMQGNVAQPTTVLPQANMVNAGTPMVQAGVSAEVSPF